ncbi:MAG: tetratricopeptide repeat protein [Phycisphaerales bacterium]|nr:tetratricopeptide repeat protein [Phycisphaerales bacterium]
MGVIVTATAASTTPHQTGRTLQPAAMVIIVILGIVAYANSLHGAFVLDDSPHIIANADLRSDGELLDLLRDHRPLVALTLAFNMAFDDAPVGQAPNPVGFHLFNLAIHLINGILLYAVIFRAARLRIFCASTAIGLAFIVAALWIVHPLTTQAVTYIIQRSEAMMAMFYLGTLYAILRLPEHPKRWTAVAILLAGLGMLTKAVMVTAPIALLCYDRCFIARSFLGALRARWPYYIGIALTWVLLAVTGVLQGVLSTDRTDNATVGFSYGARADGIGPVQYLLSQPDVILHYLRLVIWPTGLAIDYGWQPAAGARMVITVGIVTLLFLGALLLFWKRPAVGFVAMLFFIVLGPTSSFVPIRDLAYDHRMYLPLACIITLGILVGWRWLGPKRPDRMPTTVFLAPVIIGAIGLAAMTLVRTAQYHRPLDLWLDVVTKQPQNPRGWLHVGKYRADSRTPDGYADARAALQRAIQLDPAYAEAYFNLGSVEAQLGNMDRAIAYYRRCVELTPEFVQGHSSLAFAYLQSTPRRYEEAIAEFQAALALKPDFTDATNMLAVTYTARAADAMNRNDFTAAIPDLERALELVPGMPDAVRLLDTARAQSTEPSTN